MILIDYLVMNFDRHLKNYGIIRNVENLKWERVTPIFDTGECLQCDKSVNEMNFFDGNCKFFSNVNKKFSDLLKYIDLNNYNLEELKDITESFKEKLKEYQYYTDMSDERIDKIYHGLKSRINNVIKINN